MPPSNPFSDPSICLFLSFDNEKWSILRKYMEQLLQIQFIWEKNVVFEITKDFHHHISFAASSYVTNRGNARLVALGDISQQVSWVLAYFSHCYYRHYIYCILNSVTNSIKSIAFGENCNFWKSLDFPGSNVEYYF